MSDESSGPKGWQWWFGHKDMVDDDSLYAQEFATKDAAIAGALRDTFDGDEFYLIEAITAERADEDDEDSPFLFSHMRGKELWRRFDGAAEFIGSPA